MKRFLTIILTTIVSLSAFGQYKVVESSTKRAPNWLNSVQDQHLIVSATGNSIEQAKEAVLSNIKKQITQSIASRIVSETNLFTSSLQSDGSYSKTQAVESAVMSRTAKLPFIGEISLSKAIEYYWEKRYYKKEGTYEYFYAVIYPFSDFEMKKLIMDYEEHDKRLNQQLAEYEIAIENIISTEDIEANITKLTAFKEEFDYTDPRFKQTEGLITRFKQQYNNIDIDAFQEKKGLIFLTLSLGDREISTSQRPTITSNCATEISYSYEGNTLVIRYNSDNCYDDDENYIDVKYRFGTKYTTERVFIKNQVHTSLTGIIFDSRSNEPVSFARITLIPSGKSTTSGRNGLYVFNDLPNGNYSVQVMKRGYATTEISTIVSASNTTRVDIAVEQVPITPYTPNSTEVAAPVVTTPVVENSPAAATPSAPTKDPINCVRNGLSAYFRFNNNTKSETSMIQGNPINSPSYSIDSKDGSTSISFSQLDQSQLIFPKTLITTPLTNYSITFWIKGWSNGHLLSCSNGKNHYFSGNMPMLLIQNDKLHILDGSEGVFSHPPLDYNWHFIAVTVNQDEDKNVTAQLYIDGILVDSISLSGWRKTDVVKFLLGGSSQYDNKTGFDMKIDNLRIYGSRTISDEEIAKIYVEEQ